MKDLVRGGIVLSILVACVALIYAGEATEKILSIANDSHEYTPYIQSEFVDNFNVRQDIQKQDQDKEKKLVEKTVSAKATGVSRGAFVATAYCLRGRTAMGHAVRSGLIAADPRVLRMGSKVNIAGGGVAGTYLVSDTGGRIRGRKIDIWMSSCAAARKFGRRTVAVSSMN